MTDPAPRRGTPFHDSLGLRWTVDDDGHMAVDMDITDDIRGPVGSLEGGLVMTLADVAGASAAAVALKGLVATQSVSISFLAPGKVGPVRATGVVVRHGSSDVVAEVRVVDHGKDDRLMAIALVTVRRLADRT